MQNNKGLRYSALLHGLMLLFLVFGLPEFLQRKPDPEPVVTSVDILPIAQMSNVKPQDPTPEKPDVKKPLAPEKRVIKETADASKDAAQKPAPKPVEEPVKKPDAVPLPTPIKKPEIKKPEKPKPKEEIKKPEKKQEESLDDILKSVKDSAKVKEAKKPTEVKQPAAQHAATSDHYDPNQGLSMSDIDAIRQQLIKCWSAPVGSKDAKSLIVTLYLELLEDGTVKTVERKGDDSRYNSDSFFRSAADSAVRAVKRCSPLKNLPAGKYDTWKAMEMTFTPQD